jgi:peptidoglycan L-alanyl-D-glutamate endopeptidase CwlK
LAGDFVIFEHGAWSWDAAGVNAKRWKRLAEAGRQLGLEPLSFEAPHLQLAGLAIQDLAAGRYPQGGDATWEAAVKQAVESWKKAA